MEKCEKSVVPMKRIKTKVVNYLKDFNGKKVDVDQLVLNEALQPVIPENSYTKTVNVFFVKVDNPNVGYSKRFPKASALDFETDKYTYYKVYEKAGVMSFRDSAYWNLRVPKSL